MTDQFTACLDLLASINTLAVEKYERQPYYEAEVKLQEHALWKARVITLNYDDRITADAECPVVALEAVFAELQSAPSKAELDRRDFQRELAALIDKGRDIGIDDSFVNPLTEMAKKLSENALTFQLNK